MLCKPIAMASVFQSLALSEPVRSSVSIITTSYSGAKAPSSSPFHQRPCYLKLHDLHTPSRRSCSSSLSNNQIYFSVTITEETRQQNLDSSVQGVAQENFEMKSRQPGLDFSEDGSLEEAYTVSSSQEMEIPLLPARYLHLNELFVQLCAGADVPSAMDPWLHKLTLSEWNQLLIQCGRKNCDIALNIMAFFREKESVLDHNVLFSKKNMEQVAAATTEEHHVEDFAGEILNQNLENAQEVTQEITTQVEQELAPSKMERSIKTFSPLLKLYTTLIRVLTRKKSFDHIDKVETEVKEARLETNVHFYNVLLDAYIDRRSLSKAFEIYRLMKSMGFEPHMYIHEKLAHVYMNKGDRNLEVLKELAKELEGRNSTASGTLYRDLLKVYWEANDLAGVEQSFEALVAAGHTPDMKDFLKVMQLNGRRGKHERVVELIELMVKYGGKPMGSVYDFLIHAYCRAGLIEKAKETFCKYESVLHTKPTVVSINMLIHGYGKKGLHEEALQVFEEMTNYDYRRTQVSFSTIISAMAQVGKFHSAAALYERMLKVGIQPKLHTFLTLIRSYTKCDQTRQGFKIYNALRKARVEMNNTAYSVCLALFVDGNWYQHAAALLKEIEEKGVVLDAVAHSSLIRSFACLESNNTPLLRAVQESKMDICRVLASLFNATWKTQKLESGVIDAVYLILDEWKVVASLEARSLVYNAFMDYFWRKGYKEVAKGILDMGREVYAGYSRPRLVGTEWVLDVRGLGIGGAKVALKDWLFGDYEVLEDKGGDETKMVVITGNEFALSLPQDNRMVKSALQSLLTELGSPFLQLPSCSMRFEATLVDTLNWVSAMKIKRPNSLF